MKDEPNRREANDPERSPNGAAQSFHDDLAKMERLRLTVHQVRVAVMLMSIDDRARFHEWLDAWHDDDDWDRQMEADAAAGRLDALIAEADRAIEAGDGRGIPETAAEYRQFLREARAAEGHSADRHAVAKV